MSEEVLKGTIPIEFLDPSGHTYDLTNITLPRKVALFLLTENEDLKGHGTVDVKWGEPQDGDIPFTIPGPLKMFSQNLTIGGIGLVVPQKGEHSTQPKTSAMKESFAHQSIGFEGTEPEADADRQLSEELDMQPDRSQDEKGPQHTTDAEPTVDLDAPEDPEADAEIQEAIQGDPERDQRWAEGLGPYKEEVVKVQKETRNLQVLVRRAAEESDDPELQEAAERLCTPEQTVAWAASPEEGRVSFASPEGKMTVEGDTLEEVQEGFKQAWTESRFTEVFNELVDIIQEHDLLADEESATDESEDEAAITIDEDAPTGEEGFRRRLSEEVSEALDHCKESLSDAITHEAPVDGSIKIACPHFALMDSGLRLDVAITPEDASDDVLELFISELPEEMHGERVEVLRVQCEDGSTFYADSQGALEAFMGEYLDRYSPQEKIEGRSQMPLMHVTPMLVSRELLHTLKQTDIEGRFAKQEEAIGRSAVLLRKAKQVYDREGETEQAMAMVEQVSKILNETMQ